MGTMPLPAANNKISFAAAKPVMVNLPAGSTALIILPGLILVSINREISPLVMRFTVMANNSSSGDELNEYDLRISSS